MSGFKGKGLTKTTEDKNVGWVHIYSQTVAAASSVSSMSFQDGTNGVVMDSTYDEYMFVFTNLHPEEDSRGITFQVNGAGESGFNEPINANFFRAKHGESGTSHQAVGYVASYDQGGGGTAYQRLCNDVGNDNDQAVSGVFTLYEPANAGKVTHFISRMVETHSINLVMDNYVSGYIDTTAAIDEIDFKFSSGSIDDGTISMFGLAKT